MAASDHSYDRMDRLHLYGRGPLLDELMDEMSRGYTLFGFEGIGGVGKSELVDRFLDFSAERFDAHIIRIDARALQSEALMIASIYTQLREIPRHVERQIEDVGSAIAARTVGVAKRLIGAAVQDLAKYAFEKLENVAEVVKEEITGEKAEKGVAEHLEEMDTWNQRIFIGQYMLLVSDLGNRVIVSVDNYEGADTSAQEFLRFLVDSRPNGWVLCVINNTEIRPQADWATGMGPLIPYKAGIIHTVAALEEAEIAAWYTDVVRRAPSADELADLIKKSDGGRPVQIAPLLSAIRTGTGPGPLPSYAGLQQVRRSELSDGARVVAELIAFAPPNAIIPRYFLECAAARAEVGSFGAAMDELVMGRHAIEVDGNVGFSHSSDHDGWRTTIGERRVHELAALWYAAYTELRLGIGIVANTGMLPALTHEVVSHEDSTVVSALAQELMDKGAQDDALYLLDASWEVEGRVAVAEVIEHALVAAQARLDIGRYHDAQETLRSVELRGGASDTQKVFADLIRLKLALRQNSYAMVWTLSDKLIAAAPDDEVTQIERELVINTAFRDLLDKTAIRGSIERLANASASVEMSLRAKVDRSIARSFAKLGQYDKALATATSALSVARDAGDVRAIGNAELALAEALRYADRPDEAHDPYRRGADLGRGSGNRDSWIWCLLGDACAFLQEGRLEDALSVVAEARVIINEPGYEHPLEAAHTNLIEAAANLLNGEAVDIDNVVRPYRPLGIEWPRAYLEAVQQSGTLPEAVPI